ncbi:hypothetical protein J2T38_001674 [Neisseria perflava]|nr:hypothetical protein [Neisseria perflava]
MARKSANDDIGAPEFGQAGGNVAELFGMGKAVAQGFVGEVGDFDLPGRLKSGLLEAEVEAADACKQAADGGF